MPSSHSAGPRALCCPQCGARLSLATVGYTVCQYCGSSLIWNRAPEAEAPPGQVSGEPQEAVVRGVRLRRLVCTDAQGTGLELFRMLMPVGWEFQGGCRWLLDNPSMPAVVAFQVYNPQGADAFEVLPNMNFAWSKSPLTAAIFPAGSRYFGAEVRPPMDVRQALRELVLRRYRSGLRDLQILGEELQSDLPRLAKSEAPLVGGSAEGGKVRIRYLSQGRPCEEEIYGVVEVFRTPIATMFGRVEVVTWLLDYLFSFRAAATLLEANANLFLAMIGSFRLNPHWYAALKAIIQQLGHMQVQRIHHIGQIGKIYACTGREIREQNLHDWYARQSVYDRLATDRSRMLCGVEGFYDPHREEVVELPSGYGHAWTNSLGEYLLTEDPTYNPNLSSNLHWEPMPQQ